MKLSNTSEYALRILSYMAQKPDVLYSAGLLVEKLQISDKYLRRLMTQLSKAGFIKSLQGRDGGYLFAKDIKSISLADIVNAVEGMAKYSGCVLGFEHCSDANPCVMHAAWVPVREKFAQVFYHTTLAELNFENIYKL